MEKPRQKDRQVLCRFVLCGQILYQHKVSVLNEGNIAVAWEILFVLCFVTSIVLFADPALQSDLHGLGLVTMMADCVFLLPCSHSSICE